MRSLYVGLLLFTCAMMVAGCQRAKEQNVSSLVLQAPDPLLAAKSSVSAMGAPPSGRKACYGLSITAPDLASQTSSCSPQTGIVAGFVEAGGTLEASVPKGTNRKIDLYLFLQAEGENNPCPVMSQNLSGAGLRNTYLLGSVSGISILQEVETVTITANFPGLNAHLAQQLNLPATCLPTSRPISSAPGFSVSAAQGTITGSGMKIIGRVGRATSGSSATATGYKIKANPAVQ